MLGVGGGGVVDYNEVQCIIGNGHIGSPPVDRLTDTYENIT